MLVARTQSPPVLGICWGIVLLCLATGPVAHLLCNPRDGIMLVQFGQQTNLPVGLFELVSFVSGFLLCLIFTFAVALALLACRAKGVVIRRSLSMASALALASSGIGACLTGLDFFGALQNTDLFLPRYAYHEEVVATVGMDRYVATKKLYHAAFEIVDDPSGAAVYEVDGMGERKYRIVCNVDDTVIAVRSLTDGHWVTIAEQQRPSE